MTVSDENPWPGLAAFEERSANFFYGRSGQTEALMRLIRRETCTVLFGESGLGKTSLLQAGVAPLLRAEGYLPIFVRLSHAPDAESLRHQLVESLAVAQQDTAAGAAIRNEGDVWRSLHGLAPGRSENEPVGPIPVLIIDQFEEFFSRGQRGGAGLFEQQAFVEDLADLIENRPPAKLRQHIHADPQLLETYDLSGNRYRIVIALREDYLPHLEMIRARAPTLNRSRFRLERMTGDEAFDAVSGPAADLMTPQVAEQIVRFIGNDLGAGDEQRNAQLPLHGVVVDPSLLSLFCREINESRLDEGLERIDAELVRNRSANILGEFYDRALEDQPSTVRELIENELISPDGTIRFDMPVVTFKARAGAEALAALEDRRIVRIDDRKVPRVELIHDILVPIVAASRSRRNEEQQLLDHSRLLNRRVRRYRATLVGVAGAVVAIGLAWFAVSSMRSRSTAERQVAACLISLAGPTSDPGRDFLVRYKPPSDLLDVGAKEPCRADFTRILKAADKNPGEILAWWTTRLSIDQNADPLGRARTLEKVIVESGAEKADEWLVERAAARSFQSSLYAIAGHNGAAAAAQKKAAAAFGASSEARQKPLDLLSMQNSLAGFLLKDGKLQDARESFEDALELRRGITTPGRLSSGDLEPGERRELADHLAALGQVYAAMATSTRDPVRRSELKSKSIGYFSKCGSDAVDGAGFGLRKKSRDSILLRVKCAALEGKAMKQLDPARSASRLVAALGPINFDLGKAPEEDRAAFFDSLEAVAELDEGRMIANRADAKSTRRAKTYRTWVVVAKRDLYGAEPTRSHRDGLVAALMARGRYYLMLGQPDQASTDLENAAWLDSKNVGLSILRGHASLLKGKAPRALNLYQEASDRIGYDQAVRWMRLDANLFGMNEAGLDAAITRIERQRRPRKTDDLTTDTFEL